jgi:sn-glycerol 3-phosphate transport system ATP-binding protein
MGRALVRRPQAFLLDEPLSNLDAKLRTQVRGDLKRLHRELPVTSIYVTHDQVEAMTLGDRICVMSKGEVQQIGSTDDIYNRPANTFVAGFMGSPPMNLVPGDVRGGRVRVGGAELADAASGDRRVTVGFRPEDLRLVGSSESGAIPARIDFCEPLGSHVLVHAWVATEDASEDVLVIAQAPPGTSYDAGARVGLAVTAGKTYLFDAETGRAEVTRERAATA